MTEEQPLLHSTQNEIPHYLRLEHIGVMLDHPNKSTFHRKQTLYFSNLSHGKNNYWKIKLFLPKYLNSSNYPKLAFRIGTSIKVLRMKSTTLITTNDQDFNSIEFIYSNPTITKNNPHQLVLLHNHHQHYLFSLYVFTNQCSKKMYLPDFWEILVIETFFILVNNETTNRNEKDMLILWGAIFKCIQLDELNEKWKDLYASKNNLSRILVICNEILGNDSVDEYLDNMFNSEFFLLMFVFYIPNLMDDLSEEYCSSFQKTFNNIIVSHASQPAKDLNVISKAFSLFSKEPKFVKKFKDNEEKYFKTLQKTAMGTVSHMASIHAHPDNIEMFRSVLSLLNCLDKKLNNVTISTSIIEQKRDHCIIT